jgi:hypothetical protein
LLLRHLDRVGDAERAATAAALDALDGDLIVDRADAGLAADRVLVAIARRALRVGDRAAAIALLRAAHRQQAAAEAEDRAAARGTASDPAGAVATAALLADTLDTAPGARTAAEQGELVGLRRSVRDHWAAASGPGAAAALELAERRLEEAVVLGAAPVAVSEPARRRA